MSNFDVGKISHNRRSNSFVNANLNNPRANGAKRRSGRKLGARVTNFVLAEFKVVARGS